MTPDMQALSSPVDLKAQIEAERAGVPFLVYRDGGGEQRTSLSDAQRRVLVSLCRPFKEPTGYVTPATNQQIAAELYLSVDAVKTHLRALFAKFGVEDLPQNRKRVRLVELALTGGVVTPREL
jgi:hypothetical protein